MNDIIELLREHSENIPVALELPDEDRLVEVEEELLMPLPDDLREYLLYASDVVYGTLEPVTATDPRSHTYLPDVAAQAWHDGLPRYLLPVCLLGRGCYCISEEGRIQYWNGSALGKDPAGVKSWPSLWHWIQEVWLDQ